MELFRELLKTKHLIRRYHSPHQEGHPILRAVGLSVRYEGGVVLDDVDFELCEGDRTAVVGPNGAGKSTLFRIIAGVLNPSQGEVHVYGDEPGGHICIAYVPQRSQVDWTFPVSVADVVMMGRVGKMGLFRHRSSRDAAAVRAALEIVALSELADRQISQLSGGQQQRMFIAQALAQEAELMLMDEPLTGLDIASQDELFRVLDELHQRGVTVMVALHDLKLAAERFEKIMLLNRRLYGLGPPDQVLTADRLLQAYGGQLRLLHTDDGLLALEDTCCDEGDSHHA